MHKVVIFNILNVRSHSNLRKPPEYPKNKPGAKVSNKRCRCIKDLTQMVNLLSKFKNLN